MGAAASSPSSYALPPKKYDVFISFRGEDTRTNFTSHLHSALCHKSLTTYIDYELPKGDDISKSLLQAIQDSSVSVVVLSENYASSRWCLDELSHILQCRKDEAQFVIPVFYKVDPSHVRNQRGSYMNAFSKHERDFIHNHHKVKKWRDALFEIANIAGWDSRTLRDEAELIHNIADDILRKLDHRYPSALKGLVGIEENCQYIEMLLKTVPIVGIWGMGGIGKTTMAKAIFANHFSKFESYCFLENVREEAEKHGLCYIRDKLISELLGDKNLHGSTSKIIGLTSVMRRLNQKNVLIVLDDVNSSKQLDFLARECDCLGPDSRIIITTRDKHVLIGRVNEIYKAKALSNHESLKLFCFKAFHSDHPGMGYEELAKEVVVYANGIPLALTVLGSFLHSKTKREWESALRKLKKIPNDDIQNVLQLSYDELNFEEREMFLDIACFLKGFGKERVIQLFESFGFDASIGIRTLLDKALLTTSNAVVWMHDLIQAMGWEIVRQECNKMSERRSRLWDPREIYDVLKNNKGTHAIEGIMLDQSQIREVYLKADTFKKMSNLRFFKFHSTSKSCNVILPLDLESFSDRLRYFQWDGYPLKSWPASFGPENLVEICMRNSHVKKLWEGVQDLVNLKSIDFSGSDELMELPDFSKAQSLEWVYLSDCSSLQNLHPSIFSLHKLRGLNLVRCSKLKGRWSTRQLESLVEVCVLDCFSVKEYWLRSNITEYYELSETAIEILDSEHLKKLKTLFLNCSTLNNLLTNGSCCLQHLKFLYLFNCAQVVNEPNLCNLFDFLHSLEELHLDGCSNLYELPDNISALSLLRVFSLKRSSVESLPASINGLSKLERVELIECQRLHSLPELPPCLSSLAVTNCTSLETLSISYRMKDFRVANCLRLDKHSLHFIMLNAYFSFMRHLYIHRCINRIGHDTIEFWYPGSRVPEWFGHYRTTATSITVEVTHCIHHLLGFVYYAILSQSTYKVYCESDFKCRFYLEEGEEVRYLSEWQYRTTIRPVFFIKCDHVFLWHDPYCREDIFKKVKRTEDEDSTTCCNLKVSFEFKFEGDCMIKEFGVCPIYSFENESLVEWEEEQFSLQKTREEMDLDILAKIDNKIEKLMLHNMGNFSFSPKIPMDFVHSKFVK